MQKGSKSWQEAPTSGFPFINSPRCACELDVPPVTAFTAAVQGAQSLISPLMLLYENTYFSFSLCLVLSNAAKRH